VSAAGRRASRALLAGPLRPVLPAGPGPDFGADTIRPAAVIRLVPVIRRACVMGQAAVIRLVPVIRRACVMGRAAVIRRVSAHRRPGRRLPLHVRRYLDHLLTQRGELGGGRARRAYRGQLSGAVGFGMIGCLFVLRN
jgi:hypothetical protein